MAASCVIGFSPVIIGCVRNENRLERFPGCSRPLDHRAEATELMRSQRSTPVNVHWLTPWVKNFTPGPESRTFAHRPRAFSIRGRAILLLPVPEK